MSRFGIEKLKPSSVIAQALGSGESYLLKSSAACMGGMWVCISCSQLQLQCLRAKLEDGVDGTMTQSLPRREASHHQEAFARLPEQPLKQQPLLLPLMIIITHAWPL